MSRKVAIALLSLWMTAMSAIGAQAVTTTTATVQAREQAAAVMVAKGKRAKCPKKYWQREPFVAKYAIGMPATLLVDFCRRPTANGVVITAVRVPAAYKAIVDINSLELLVINTMDDGLIAGPKRVYLRDSKIKVSKKWRSTGHIYCYWECNVQVAGKADVRRWPFDASFGGFVAVGR
jgi:hypothetical protein